MSEINSFIEDMHAKLGADSPTLALPAGPAPTPSRKSGPEFLRAAQQANLRNMHFENNTALREYVLGLAEMLLDKGAESVDPALPSKEFCEQVNIKRGLILASQLLRQEVADMRQMSMEEYCS